MVTNMDNTHDLYETVNIYRNTVDLLFVSSTGLTCSHQQCYWFADDHQVPCKEPAHVREI